MCGKIILKFVLIIYDFLKFRNTKLYESEVLACRQEKNAKDIK